MRPPEAQSPRVSTDTANARTPRRGVGRLLRPVIWLLVAALLVIAAWQGAPRLLERSGLDQSAMPWGPECTVSIDGAEETTALTVAEAREASTAVAVAARAGDEAEVSGIDEEVLDQLRHGPEQDAGPSLTCRANSTEGLEREEMTESGLTPRAETLLAETREVFGDVSVGGFEPGGVDEGHSEGSTHYEGRAVDVFFRPVTEESRREGWLLAHWLVAHAEELDVSVVIFDDHIWSMALSAAGWRDYEVGTDDEVLRHLDHVHVDVQQGD